MHPSKFFDEVKFTDKDIGIIQANDEIIDKLMSVHPRNFLSTSITFGIIELEVSYDSKSGNRKTSTKYVIQKYEPNECDDPDFIAEIQVESDIDRYNSMYPESELKNYKVESAKLLCFTTLPIG